MVKGDPIISNLIFFNALFQNLQKLSIMHQFAFLPFASLVGFAFVVSVSYTCKELLDFFLKAPTPPQDYDEQRHNEDNIKHVTRDWSFRTTSKNEQTIFSLHYSYWIANKRFYDAFHCVEILNTYILVQYSVLKGVCTCMT